MNMNFMLVLLPRAISLPVFKQKDDWKQWHPKKLFSLLFELLRVGFLYSLSERLQSEKHTQKKSHNILLNIKRNIFSFLSKSMYFLVMELTVSSCTMLF